MLSFAHATVTPLHSVYEISNCNLAIDDYHLTWDRDYVTFSRIVKSTDSPHRERNFAYRTLRCFVAVQGMLVQFPLSMENFRWNLIKDDGAIHSSRERYKSIQISKLEPIDIHGFVQHLTGTQHTLKLLPHYPELYLAIVDFNLAHNAEADDLRLIFAWRALEQLRGAMPGRNGKQKWQALRKLLPDVTDRDYEFLQSLAHAKYLLNRHASEDPGKTQMPRPMDAQVFQLIVRDAIVNYISYLISQQSGVAPKKD